MQAGHQKKKKKKGKKEKEPVFFKTELRSANELKWMCRTERNREQWGQNKERTQPSGQDGEGEPVAQHTEKDRAAPKETLQGEDEPTFLPEIGAQARTPGVPSQRDLAGEKLEQ